MHSYLFEVSRIFFLTFDFQFQWLAHIVTLGVERGAGIIPGLFAVNFLQYQALVGHYNSPRVVRAQETTLEYEKRKKKKLVINVINYYFGTCKIEKKRKRMTFGGYHLLFS